MEKEMALPKAIEYLAKNRIVYLASIGEDGFPEVRAMGNGGTEDLGLWMITNKSSRKSKQIMTNPKTSLYCGEWGDNALVGLKLIGTAEMVDDEETKKKMWRDEYSQWYQQGVEDPEYVLIKFTPKMMCFHEGMDYCDCEV